MSKITIFSTKGQKKSVIESSATTWGELKKELADANIPTWGMRAIIGENKNTLESSVAVLPVDFDFTLFLSPIKVKSGVNINSMNRKVLYAFIKEQRSSNTEAITFFSGYPSKSTDNLKKLVKKWLDKVAIVSTKQEMVSTDDKEVVLEAIEIIKVNLEKVKEYIINHKVEVSEGITVEELQAKFAEIEATL